MEFIQKKTADKGITRFLNKAADLEVNLAWDRYEGQLPECGFCEAGLSCRDCLQGPCISHPFRDSSKSGVCGKDKDVLAVQSLLRLAIKGCMAQLDQLNDLAHDIKAGSIAPKDSDKTAELLRHAQDLFTDGGRDNPEFYPKIMTDRWESAGVRPVGGAADLFKASQKLEGGISKVEDHLLWTFRTALLACMARSLKDRLQRAVFGTNSPTHLEVGLGLLQSEKANVLLYGPFSPILKHKIAQAAEGKNAAIMGVCTDPLLPPYRFPPITSYGSQEIPIMTGAVDLIVTGDQFVNPSLAHLAREWQVKVIPTERVASERDPDALAREVIAQAEKAFELRRDIPRDVPEQKAAAVLGFAPADLDIGKIVAGLDNGKIKGIVFLAGCNNVKYTQDYEFVAMAQEFLKNDILCLAEGEAGVSLAKYGFLDPQRNSDYCGEGVKEVLASLGGNIPAVPDCNATDVLTTLADLGKNGLEGCPMAAYFAEASRSTDVAQALWMVAMGIPVYFWPSLPVTGSHATVKALTDLCGEKFGAPLHVYTQKMEPKAKADLFLREITKPPSMSGKPWQE